MYVMSVKSSTGDDISEHQATRDLASMSSTGLFLAHGDKRGRHYVASPELRKVWIEIRETRPPQSAVDPYALARRR